MNEVIWKIESEVSGGPKVELVKVVRTSFTNVMLHSIMDGYEFQMNKNYFMRNRKVATQEDIDKYEFQLND